MAITFPKVMPAFCVAFPLLSGKEEKLKEFGKLLNGSKLREFEKSQQRMGVQKEAWFHQKTPQGDLVLIYFESSNPVDSLMKLVQSKDSFDMWFKAETKELTGVDASDSSDAPPPQLVMSYGY
jgi:hypothetical protein